MNNQKRIEEIAARSKKIQEQLQRRANAEVTKQAREALEKGKQFIIKRGTDPACAIAKF